jgi:hypothetical protein
MSTSKPSTSHDRADKPANRSSDRAFGVFFALLALILGVWPVISGGRPVLVLLGIGLLLLIVAAAMPKLLRPFNRLWFEFGLLLHKLISPLVLGLIYLTSVVPVGLLMRMFAKDPLRRRFEPELHSYWIPRDPPGPQSDSLPRQF